MYLVKILSLNLMIVTIYVTFICTLAIVTPPALIYDVGGRKYFCDRLNNRGPVTIWPFTMDLEIENNLRWA